jgi:2,4-dienoyl-CoA reductase-like NADH-dependent reductase (Old Yellow Enzyme family)/thioredoxin reductase
VYEHVLSPITIGNVELRNRVVRTAHGTGHTPGGVVSDELIGYHLARAKGGVALSIIEIAGVHPSSPGTLIAWFDGIIPGWQRLADAVHAEGMKVFQQLFHGGHNVPSVDGGAPWSASAVPGPQLGLLPQPMTQGQIDEVVAAYAAAARRAREGGLDGVEIHAAHGYLPGQFLCPATNHRTDDYGGPLENRLRFTLEIVDAVRAAVGEDFVVGIRLSPEGAILPGALDVAEVAQVVHRLDGTGKLDYLNVSLGSYYAFDRIIGGTHEPHRYELPDTGGIRSATLPKIVTGRFTTLAEADEVIASGQADMVSIVRALIADPDLIPKTVDGRADDVRPCIACNQSCVGGVFGPRMRLNCTVNVGVGKELTLGDDRIPRTSGPRRIVVVGGGPAGLEAARVAAIAGHDVTLYEAADALGGQLRFTRQSPFRSDVAGIVDWFERQLSKLGVKVELDVEADASLIEQLAPEAVVLATGATPRRDGFQSLRPGYAAPGLDPGGLFTSWDVLGGRVPDADEIVVVDDLGHFEAIDVAEFLAEQGRHVHFVTRYPTLGFRLEGAWDMMGKPHLERLWRRRFDLHTRTLLVAVESAGAVIAPLEGPDRRAHVPAGAVVMVSGSLPNRSLAGALSEFAGEVRVVGDAVTPRLLEVAVTEGHMAALSLAPEWRAPETDASAVIEQMIAAQH